MTEKYIDEKLAALKAELMKEIKTKTKEQRFIEIINGLEIKIDREKYPDSVFFFKGSELWFELEKSTLWCRYKHVWYVFEAEFGMEYAGIQSFISNQMEEHFKMKGVTPCLNESVPEDVMEEHFKMKGLTP